MANEEMRREARMLVLEYMLQRQTIAVYGLLTMTPSQIKQQHAAIRKRMSQEKWSSDDPGQSALISGEVEDAFDRYLRSLESMLVSQGLLPKP